MLRLLKNVSIIAFLKQSEGNTSLSRTIESDSDTMVSYNFSLIICQQNSHSNQKLNNGQLRPQIPPN